MAYFSFPCCQYLYHVFCNSLSDAFIIAVFPHCMEPVIMINFSLSREILLILKSIFSDTHTQAFLCFCLYGILFLFLYAICTFEFTVPLLLAVHHWTLVFLLSLKVSTFWLWCFVHSYLMIIVMVKFCSATVPRVFVSFFFITLFFFYYFLLC